MGRQRAAVYLLSVLIMNKFLFRTIVFSSVLILLLFFGGRNLGDAVEKSDFMGAIADKHKRLESISGKKIIFAGGSNLAFGLDSKRVEDSIGLPVVNLGLHAGLGLDFILNELNASIKKEDVVFLSIEYYLGSKGMYELQQNAISYFPEALSYVQSAPPKPFEQLRYLLNDRIENIKTNLGYVISRLRNKPSKTAYRRKYFNKQGDSEGHLNLESNSALADGGEMYYYHWEGISKLNIFYEQARAKGVRVYFIYTNYPVSQFELNKKTIEKYQQDLQRELLIPILGAPQDFVYPDSYFFDTVYHLNRKGRENRTVKVIELIKKADQKDFFTRNRGKLSCSF